MEDVDVLGILRRSAELAPDPFGINGTESIDTHSWTPIDIVLHAAEPPEPPTIGGIVYPGRRHLFSGEPEALKSWAAMVLCVEQIRAGHTVLYADFEMGGRETLARLRDLKVTDDELNSRFIYLEPDEPFTDTLIQADTALLLAERRPTLVIIDAFTGALQVHSLDPNKSIDIETFYRNVVDPLRVHNAAVVVLDHLPKDTASRGRFAIGSERKVGAAEVHLGFEVIAPFGRGRVGKAKIVTHKDRPGHLKRPRAAELELTSNPTTGEVTWKLIQVEATADVGQPFRPTHLMEKVSRYLELQTVEVSLNQIEGGVTGQGEFIRKAVIRLVIEDYASEQSGPRNARLFTSLKPYREADDTLEEPTSSTSSDLVSTSSPTGLMSTSSTSSPPVTTDEVPQDEDDEVKPDDLVSPDELDFTGPEDAGPPDDEEEWT